jgi:hypothetical protein
LPGAPAGKGRLRRKLGREEKTFSRRDKFGDHHKSRISLTNELIKTLNIIANVTLLPVTRCKRSNNLTEEASAFSSAFVRRLKCSLSWALLALTFAMALVPANGLTIVHSHDDDHTEHHAGLLGLSDALHDEDLHPSEGLHSHRVGWSQMQKLSAQREVTAPVLVAQVWLNVSVPTASADHSPRLLRRCAESKLVHAPPPLLRSMAFLI